MIIAKQTNQEVINNNSYELFTPIKMTGVDGEEVDVLQSIGSYNLEQLNRQKEEVETNYQKQLADLDEKINAINLL